MKTKFKTASGRLTSYALACGYVEEFNTHSVAHGQSVRLWREAGCEPYHVRHHDFDAGKRIVWRTFKKLSEARKAFDKIKKGLTAKYRVHCGFTPAGRSKWRTFDTFEEANGFCEQVRQSRGVFLSIIKR